MKFLTSILVSVAIHALLAVGIIAYLEYAPGPKTLAMLDVSSVELSFSETEAENSARPEIPAAPEIPKTPDIPDIPEKPETPDIPDIPEKPETPEIPDTPGNLEIPKIPQTPDIPEKMVTPPRPKPTPASEPAAAAAPTPAPRQARIDAPPRQRSSIKPDYPKGARQRGEQGDVVLELSISKSGDVDAVVVVGSCGFPELDDAAVAAAKKARFTPAKSGDSSVASKARLTLTFKLK